MSLIAHSLHPQTQDLGAGFTVRRVLPSPERDMVGPFIFFDHMGPLKIQTGDELQVRSHPHIGLATMTWLFSGEIIHRDSLGYEQAIHPGEVNWMTAGEWIVHSERTRKASDFIGQNLEGIQIWVALPKEQEDCAPEFLHYPASALPVLEREKGRYTLIAGSLLDMKSEIRVHSDLFYLEAQVQAGEDFEIPLSKGREGAIYVAQGKVFIDAKVREAGELVIFNSDTALSFQADEEARLMIFGGTRFPEKRYKMWNWVSSDRAKIEAAKQRWLKGDWKQATGEIDFIPLPEHLA